MLPKNERLTRKDIELIMKGGQTIDSPFFRFKYLTGKDSFKFSPVVSKKIAKTAVLRNKIRRELYSFVAGAPNGALAHVLVFVKKRARDLDKEEYFEEFRKNFLRIS